MVRIFFAVAMGCAGPILMISGRYRLYGLGPDTDKGLFGDILARANVEVMMMTLILASLGACFVFARIQRELVKLTGMGNGLTRREEEYE
ncbi:hypothetical protein [Alcanivorax sp.]|jgi:hypothetical protein|uniref:hypothetical protein n=1 Tax=Alcanivorax sp. TaxID=1872427 RepID=UPI0032D973F9